MEIKCLIQFGDFHFYKDYNKELSSEFTDLNNAPLSGMAGAITAALFLKKFTKSHKMFLHFDIFGWNTKSKPGKTYGGLMQGVRSLGTAIEEKFFKFKLKTTFNCKSCGCF